MFIIIYFLNIGLDTMIMMFDDDDNDYNDENNEHDEFSLWFSGCVLLLLQAWLRCRLTPLLSIVFVTESGYACDVWNCL